MVLPFYSLLLSFFVFALKAGISMPLFHSSQSTTCPSSQPSILKGYSAIPNSRTHLVMPPLDAITYASF